MSFTLTSAGTTTAITHITAHPVIATASVKLFSLVKSFILFKLNRNFVYYQHLLILQILVICRKNTSLHTIFILRRRLIPMIGPLPNNRCCQLIWQLEFKRNSIVSASHCFLKFKALLTKIHNYSLMLFKLSRLLFFGFVGVPVTTNLFAFYSNFKMFRLKEAFNTNVDLSIYSLILIIKRLICFNIEIATIKFRSCVNFFRRCLPHVLEYINNFFNY